MNRTFLELPGWIFDVDEVSAGVYQVVASDIKGHRICRVGTDPTALIEECRSEAIMFLASVGSVIRTN